jgi:hypothetical protein
VCVCEEGSASMASLSRRRESRGESYGTVDTERGCALPLPLKGVVGLEGDSGSCLAMLGLLGSLAT